MIKAKHIALLAVLFLGCQKIKVERITKIITDDPVVVSSDVSIDGVVVDVSDIGGVTYGHCWSTDSTPTVDDFKTVFDIASAGTYYTSIITGLQFNTVYYIRSYTHSNDEVIYGDTKSFIIDDVNNIQITANNLTILGENEVNLQGMLTGTQSLTLQDYGICYELDSLPTINSEVISYGSLSQNVAIDQDIDSLFQERHYKFRLYAQLDNANVLYSNVLSTFITDLHVTTHNAYVSDSVIFSGTIDSLGVLPVTDHGHCWSYLTSNPSINDELISHGPTSTEGTYISVTHSLNNVTNTTVYYRAYAIKENVIVYGAINSFNL